MCARSVTQSCQALCHPAGLLCPQDSPGKNTGVGCYALRQGIFPTQGSNPGLPNCRRALYHLSHQGIIKQTTVYFNFTAMHTWQINSIHGNIRQTFWLTEVTIILSLQCIARTKDENFYTFKNSQKKKKNTLKIITKNKTQAIKVLYQLSIDRTCA